MSLINNIAKSGCTVVCAIHQPNSLMIEKFDDIFVLAEGRSFYCGPRDNIIQTCKEAGFICPAFYNIAEFGENCQVKIKLDSSQKNRYLYGFA